MKLRSRSHDKCMCLAKMNLPRPSMVSPGCMVIDKLT